MLVSYLNMSCSIAVSHAKAYRKCVATYVHICSYVVCICIYVCMYCIYVHACICMYICIAIQKQLVYKKARPSR